MQAFLLIGFTRNGTRNVLFTRHCIYCAIYITYFYLKYCFKQFKPTLFNKYSDNCNLQPPQICQVREYPGVKIQNVIGTKIPVKTKKQAKNSRGCSKVIFL